MGESKNEPVSAALAAELAKLPSLDEVELFRIWRVQIGRRVPKHLPRHLFIRFLAYRIQAQAFGDLDRNARSRLEQLAREKQLGTTESASFDIRVRPKAGSVLVREHQGELHRVMVLSSGYTWSGQTYSSLSQVAFAITGTKWNGPRFFGLDKNMPGRSKGVGR